MKYPTMRFVFDRKKVATKTHKGLVQIEVLSEGKRKWIGTGVKVYWKIQCKLPPKTKRFCPLVLK